ncbi:subclass B3 metallo-beta-lactamase [Parasphingorhabdus sp.]|uniref:subclass B3 metallo-beta-lactamase n=1 Tax=Parasphingorhabdus sp. TaxID=2709688 RepID=UPI0032659BC1
MALSKFCMALPILVATACVSAPSAETAGETDTLSTISKLAETKQVPGFDWQKNFPSWFQKQEPFRIIGGEGSAVYYVGNKGLGALFIPTSEGHIVIDGAMPGQGQWIADSITRLGFDPKEVKILLNSHAHIDHSGGLAELKEITGARLFASAGDKSALEGGFYLGSEDVEYLNAPPVTVDRVIADGETVTLGAAKLTAHITPGHTRGCTSWMMDVDQGGESYETLFFCSASVAANRLVGPPQYEGIVADYRQTFATTRDWKPDVFLSNHAEFFGMAEKRDKQIAGDPLAFVDREGFPAMMGRLEAAFEKALQKQKEARK